MRQADVQLVERLLHLRRLVSGKVDRSGVDQKLGDVLRDGVAVERHREVKGAVGLGDVILAHLRKPGGWKNPVEKVL